MVSASKYYYYYLYLKKTTEKAHNPKGIFRHSWNRIAHNKKEKNQDKNSQKTKMGRKTIVGTFHVTNKRDLTRTLRKKMSLLG